MLGSPRVISNQNAQIVSRRDFMPFGEDLTRANYGSDTIRQKFTGYEKDTETGLDFAEARYYNSAHGRFTAVDPLLASGKSANPQTFNRYVYTMNNPVNLTDPSGMITCPPNCNEGQQVKGVDGTNYTYTTSNTGGGVIATVDAAPYEPSPIDQLAASVSSTLNDIETGSPRGAANFFIGLINAGTNMAINSRGGVYNPGLMPSNPIEIERYNYDTLTQARWGTAIETGLTLAPSVVAPVVGAGTVTEIGVGKTANEGTSLLRNVNTFEINPRVAGQLQDARLGNLAGNLVESDLQTLVNNPAAQRLFDTSSGHINVIQQVDNTLLRITVPRDAMKIISVGPIRANGVVNGINSGRFVPLR